MGPARPQLPYVGAGEWVSIAGPSGGGKTTLPKLLAGLLQPTSGVILVNGEPMARLGPEAWRRMIGVVMQDDQLFAGSIADNVSFFAAGADPQRIEDCARRAAVHDDIASMPMGYDTLIGDMGILLSGGQKQRAVLARALFPEPGLLLLDEATSHLDVAKETAVNADLKEMALTRTVIAHRPETALASSRVITLETARVALDERRAAPGLVGREARAPQQVASGYLVSVSDSGPGMTQQDEEQVFERFYRGSNAAQRYDRGTGLGLPVAKAIIEAHGGEIALRSAPGEGVKVVFTLPTRPALRAVS